MKKWINLLLFIAVTAVVVYLIFKASTILATILGVGVVAASCYLGQIADSLEELKEKKAVKKAKTTKE